MVAAVDARFGRFGNTALSHPPRPPKWRDRRGANFSRRPCGGCATLLPFLRTETRGFASMATDAALPGRQPRQPCLFTVPSDAKSVVPSTLWQQLLLLGFDPERDGNVSTTAAGRARSRSRMSSRGPGPDMFRQSNETGLIAVLHFLFSKLSPAYAEVLRAICSPPRLSSAHNTTCMYCVCTHSGFGGATHRTTAPASGSSGPRRTPLFKSCRQTACCLATSAGRRCSTLPVETGACTHIGGWRPTTVCNALPCTCTSVVACGAHVNDAGVWWLPECTSCCCTSQPTPSLPSSRARPIPTLMPRSLGLGLWKPRPLSHVPSWLGWLGHSRRERWPKQRSFGGEQGECLPCNSAGDPPRRSCERRWHKPLRSGFVGAARGAMRVVVVDIVVVCACRMRCRNSRRSGRRQCLRRCFPRRPRCSGLASCQSCGTAGGC